MTAVLDFAAVPPEINSARMYAGPGSGPMLAAASAWSGLAAELRDTELSYSAVLAALTGQEWYGPASASMAAAATPYVAWMSSTAVLAEQTAAQAGAAAGAYEAAFAATVPPAVVAANRTALMALIATNIVGQNTPAIAATEAQYLEMWAQDAAAMYGYAGSSAAATQLSPFLEPAQTTTVDGLAAQSGAVAQAGVTSAASTQSALSELIAAVPAALQGLSGTNGTAAVSDVANLMLTGSGSSGLENFWYQWGPNANFWNTVTSSGLMVPGSTFGSFLSLASDNAAAAEASAAAGASGVGGAAAGPLGTLGGTSAVSAGIGNAATVGKLAVPPAWTAAAPPASHLSSAIGTPMIAPPPAAGAAGMPGVPVGTMGHQHFGRAVPQYGFKPTFIIRPPAAG